MGNAQALPEESPSGHEGCKYTQVTSHSVSCSRAFLKTQGNEVFNSERTAGLRDFSPDTHPVRGFWQGSRVNDVTGTKAVTAEPVIDQKVRIQSHCFPKLQRLLSICSGL